jgi:hypothetical protein
MQLNKKRKMQIKRRLVMNAAAPKPKDQNAPQDGTREAQQGRMSELHDVPSSILYQSELLWWPYRSFARFMLPNCHNTTALMQISRRFADEVRDIVRREQDFVFDQQERFFRRSSKDNGTVQEAGPFGADTFEELYESAISSVREFTKAIADAQVRSIEALRQHSRETVKTTAKTAEDMRAAA